MNAPSPYTAPEAKAYEAGLGVGLASFSLTVKQHNVWGWLSELPLTAHEKEAVVEAVLSGLHAHRASAESLYN